ncbi:MAG TPA: OmpA family protein [Chitinophagales bacterium]|nr:OmpA family protein [Chitinophagales bacterium]
MAISAHAQIAFDTSYTAKQLVDSFLTGQGMRVGNITFIGPHASIGHFKAGNNAIGVENGILLSTGKVIEANGPNNSPWTTTSFSPVKSKTRPKGDRDLNRISKSVTYDVSFLEFDFIPFNNRITFSYVFGSEEYPEYVGSRYNDVFAFIVDGEKLRHVNLATVPRTLLPVTVNNINSKQNKGFYINNDYFKKVDLKKNLPGKEKVKKDKTPYSDYYETDKKRLKKLNQTLVQTVQFDGITVLMTASCYVVPFKKYHMKIAIGDVGDPQYDSGVFLEEGSFRSERDPSQTKFKDYPDLSSKLNFDSIFGLKPILTKVTKDSIAKEQEEYERFTLTNINFETDKYIIPDTSKNELTALGDYLLHHKNFRCELYGYTDNVGSKKYNQHLSESRAFAVMNFLVAKKIDASRLKIVGYNFENPIADNTDERGRAVNRRVEIVLVEE